MASSCRGTAPPSGCSVGPPTKPSANERRSSRPRRWSEVLAARDQLVAGESINAMEYCPVTRDGTVRHVVTSASSGARRERSSRVGHRLRLGCHRKERGRRDRCASRGQVAPLAAEHLRHGHARRRKRTRPSVDRRVHRRARLRVRLVARAFRLRPDPSRRPAPSRGRVLRADRQPRARPTPRSCARATPPATGSSSSTPP